MKIFLSDENVLDGKVVRVENFGPYEIQNTWYPFVDQIVCHAFLWFFWDLIHLNLNILTNPGHPIKI